MTSIQSLHNMFRKTVVSVSDYDLLKLHILQLFVTICVNVKNIWGHINFTLDGFDFCSRSSSHTYYNGFCRFLWFHLDANIFSCKPQHHRVCSVDAVMVRL